MRAREPALVIAHAPADHAYARQLAAFLERGCDVRCDPQAGLLKPGEDLADLAAGPSSDPLILLLSRESWPERLPRERWDPALLAPTQPMACVLLNSCPFPPLLARRAFFDVREGNADRGLKRWLWQQRFDPNVSPRYEWSADLEDLYAALADQPGAARVAASGQRARRFAREASGEFEGVVWLPCHGRTRVETAGDLGHRLALVLDGQEAQNLRRIHDFLAIRRYLVVLDAPADPAPLTGSGRASTLVTAEPVEIRETPRTFEYARELVKQQRLAEAYEMFYALMIDPEKTAFCAQELSSICKHWGRAEEARRLSRFDLQPTRQMGMFDLD